MGNCNFENNCADDDDDYSLYQSGTIKYENNKFIIPQKLHFANNDTYRKVQAAAYNFCEQNNISKNYFMLISQIIAFRHEVLFQKIYERLQKNQREQFIEDLSLIQHDLMDSFYHHFLKPKKYITMLHHKNGKKFLKNRQKIQQPHKIFNNHNENPKIRNELRRKGKIILQQNKIGVILMCGGNSNNFNNHDKFLQPISLIKNTTLLQIFFHRLIKNNHNNPNLCIIIGCNQYNYITIRNYLEQHRYYGFNNKLIRFMETYSLPVLNIAGKYCFTDKIKFIKSSPGTARNAEELLNTSCYNFLKKQNIKYVHFCGLQNLLEEPLDLIFIGLCEQYGLHACGKCTNPLYFSQNLPRYVGSNLNMKNYQQLQSLQQGLLDVLPVAMNSIIFNLEQLNSIIKNFETSIDWVKKYHLIQRKDWVYNFDSNTTQQINTYSFEKDLRDLMGFVSKSMLFNVVRHQQYVPIITQKDKYSLVKAVDNYQQRIIYQLSIKQM